MPDVFFPNVDNSWCERHDKRMFTSNRARIGNGDFHHAGTWPVAVLIPQEELGELLRHLFMCDGGMNVTFLKQLSF